MEHSSNKGIILILSILFIVVMMIPITGLIVAPSEIDWLEQPRYELGGMTLNEIFVDNAQYLETEQLITNGDFSDGTTGWAPVSITGNVIDNVFSFTSISEGGRIGQAISEQTTDDKYYLSSLIKSDSSSVVLYGQSVSYKKNHSGSGNFEYLSVITTLTSGAIQYPRVADERTSGWTQVDIDYLYTFNISTLIANNQYSPLFDTTFDLMSDADIKTQMDLWVTEGLDTLNIWLTYNAVGLDHILSYDEMLDYYQLYLSYL